MPRTLLTPEPGFWFHVAPESRSLIPGGSPTSGYPQVSTFTGGASNTANSITPKSDCKEKA